MVAYFMESIELYTCILTKYTPTIREALNKFYRPHNLLHGKPWQIYTNKYKATTWEALNKILQINENLKHGKHWIIVIHTCTYINIKLISGKHWTSLTDQ
jgi:hypothetical protein